jgi:hypothetical protein
MSFQSVKRRCVQGGRRECGSENGGTDSTRHGRARRAGRAGPSLTQLPPDQGLLLTQLAHPMSKRKHDLCLTQLAS